MKIKPFNAEASAEKLDFRLTGLVLRPVILAADVKKGEQRCPNEKTRRFQNSFNQRFHRVLTPRRHTPSPTKKRRKKDIFTATHPLYLASTSPRRIEFLRLLGLSFDCLTPPPSAEPAPLAGENATDYAVRAARAKAEAVLLPTGGPPRTIVAADTIVVLDDRILGKPRDSDEARAMLALLAGRTHTVISGCALYVGDTGPVTFAVSSAVTMWACPDDMLNAYVRSGEPLDKAGAYAVQGAGAFLVERIEGSWSNVVGLPLAELLRELVRLGAVTPDPRA